MCGCPRFHPFGYIGNAGFPVPPDARDAEPEAKWRWTEGIAEQDGAERKGYAVPKGKRGPKHPAGRGYAPRAVSVPVPAEEQCSAIHRMFSYCAGPRGQSVVYLAAK